jgi:polysaccharide export outer membrane protein
VKKSSAFFCLGTFLVVNAALSEVGGLSAQDIPAPAGEALPAVSLPEYRVNPGDELQISVWREDQLQRAVMVLPDGTISFPLVGRISAAGQSTREIEEAISRGLAIKYVDGNVPDVTVAVTKTSGLQFSVIGKVRSPGSFTPGRYLTLLEAVSLAGGVDEFANLDNVVVVRKSGNGLVVIPVKLSGILRSRSVSTEAVNALPLIRSGDTVIVP